MNQAKVPQLLVATGAAKWGNEIEQYPYTIGYQADYESEGKAYAKYALEQNPDAKIGVLYANDDFGKDYLTGIKEGLGDKVDQLVSEVTYETTDATVDSQVSQVKDSGADVVHAHRHAAVRDPGHQAGRRPRLGAAQDPHGRVGLGRRGHRAGRHGHRDRLGVGHVHQGPHRSGRTPTIRRSCEYKEVLQQYYPDANPDDDLYLYGMSVGPAVRADHGEPAERLP